MLPPGLSKKPLPIAIAIPQRQLEQGPKTCPLNRSLFPQSPSRHNRTRSSHLRTNSADDDEKKMGLYKTELCRSWEETGACRYGNKCQFAHSREELRVIDRHPKYKTEMCKTFWEKGTCPYGKRCCFIHTDKTEYEKRNILQVRTNMANEMSFHSPRVRTNSIEQLPLDISAARLDALGSDSFFKSHSAHPATTRSFFPESFTSSLSDMNDLEQIMSNVRIDSFDIATNDSPIPPSPLSRPSVGSTLPEPIKMAAFDIFAPLQSSPASRQYPTTLMSPPSSPRPIGQKPASASWGGRF